MIVKSFGVRFIILVDKRFFFVVEFKYGMNESNLTDPRTTMICIRCSFYFKSVQTWINEIK